MSQGYYNPDQNVFYVTDDQGNPTEAKPLDLAVKDGDISGDMLKAIDQANTDRMMSPEKLQMGRAAEQAQAHLKSGAIPAGVQPVASVRQADPNAGGAPRPLVSLADLAPQADYSQPPASSQALAGDSGGPLGMAQKFVTGAAMDAGGQSGIPPDVADYVGRYQAQQDQLKAAQAESNRRAMLALLEHAGETFSSAASHGRAPVDEGFTRNALALSGAPVEQAQQNIGMERQTDAIDPSSPQNQRARAAWEALMPELGKQPGWSQVTEPEIEKFLTEQRYRKQLAMQEQLRTQEQTRIDETLRHNQVMESQAGERTDATKANTALNAAKFSTQRESAQVPGFVGPALNEKEAEGGRAMLDANRTLNKYLDEMDEIAKLPVQERVTPSMRQRVTTLRNSIIGTITRAQQLGGFTAEHQKLGAEDMANLNGLMGTADPAVVRASVAQMRSDINAARDSWAANRGGRWQAGAAPTAGGNAAQMIQRGQAAVRGEPSGPAVAPPQAGTFVTVRRKKDGKAKSVPQAMAAEILKSPDYEAVAGNAS